MAAKKKASKKKVATKKKATKKKVVTKKKATKKKLATKKKVARKKVASKATRQKAAAAAPKKRAIMQKQTKLQIIRAIADEVELTQKEVAAVFESLASMIKRHMQRRGSGMFVIPDTGVKIRRVRKPARKARMGRNPATGESIRIPAKPASTAIKVTALKPLKETVK